VAALATVLVAVGIVLLATAAGASSAAAAQETKPRLNLVFCCAADNDLYRVMSAGGASYARVESPAEAISKAAPGAGILILADGYPQKTVNVPRAVFDAAAEKGLRLFVEYPASLPEMKLGAPRPTKLERAVVASDAFGPSLKRLRILALHDCRFVEVEAPKQGKRGRESFAGTARPPFGRCPVLRTKDSRPLFPADLVVARIAGFDTAVFGLEDVKTWPLLFEHRKGTILVSTTKLS